MVAHRRRSPGAALIGAFTGSLPGALFAALLWSIASATSGLPTMAAVGAITSTDRRTVDVPTAEEIAAARAAIETEPVQDPAVRDQVIALLDVAQRAIDAERPVAQQLLELQQELAGLPAQREAIAADMAQMIDVPVVPPTDATIEQLRAARDEAQANLRTAVDRRQNLERELALRAERRAVLPDEIAGLEDALDEIEQAITAGPSPDLAPALVVARKWALAAQRAEIVRRIAVARAELAFIDARPEIDALRREHAARRVMVRESAMRQWEATAVDAESRRAEAAATEARRVAAEASPAIRDVAERTADLVYRLNSQDPEVGLIVRNRETATMLTLVETRLARLARQYEQDRRRVLDIGMAGLTTIRLQRQRAELPDLRVLSRGRTKLRQEIGRTQRELTDLEIERESMPSLLVQRDQILSQFPEEPDDVLRDALIAELDRRLADRQRTLDLLIVALRDRDDLLLQIQDRLVPLTALTREYIGFIDERILWLRSMDPLNFRDVGAAWDSTWTNIRPSAVGGFAAAAGTRVAAAPVLPGMVLLGIAAATWAAVKLRRRRAAIADRIKRPHTDRFSYTIELTAVAVAWAAVWPAAVALVGWLAGAIHDPASLGPRIAGGLSYVAWLLFALRLVGEITRHDGLAIAHYGWRPESCSLLRGQLRWFGPLTLVLVFIQGALEYEQSRVGTDALARLATMMLSGAAALLVLRLLGPRRGLLVGIIASSRAAWLGRALNVAFPVLFGVPALLVVLDALGFSFTVNQLHFAIFQTILFSLGLVLASGLLTRWLLITRRRLSMEEARKRRAAATVGDDGQAVTADGDLLAIENTGLDLVAIDAQTRQLTRTGLAATIAIGLLLIWGHLLPALGMLGRIELWPNFAQVREGLVAPPPIDDVIGEQAIANIRRSGIVAAGPYVAVFTAAGVPISTPSVQEQVPPTAAPETFVQPPAGVGPSTTPSAGATPSGVGPTGRMTGESGPTAPVSSGMPGMTGMPGMPAARAEPTPSEDAGRISVANVLLAALITALAILISRNIPGLIEIAVLQRLPMTASGRYAVTALTRYVIAVGAIFLAFGAIGIGWNNVQWLVAAATVGIAFGLQEIVANFISGVIILFEQPIRVGDTVTLNNVSGTVTKIRMRATTITDWDRKELIIPNKEFITGQVINWTLSDPTLRLVIPVGIAYGSDTALAEKLLVECARNHPIVLREPPPSVVYTRFGDSSLDFELRAFLPSIEHLVRVRHDLHNAVDQAFRKNGIEIAFPQRDVHVRDIAGQLGIRRGRRPTEEPAADNDAAPPPANPTHREMP